VHRLKIPFFAFLSVLAVLTTPGCANKRTSVTAPTVALQTQTYVVVQTSPGNFTVLTRSKTAIDEISRRLGCYSAHICSNEWNGEVWTIQRLK
jgi:allophanate hydrolase subunit 1